MTSIYNSAPDEDSITLLGLAYKPLHDSGGSCTRQPTPANPASVNFLAALTVIKLLHSLGARPHGVKEDGLENICLCFIPRKAGDRQLFYFAPGCFTAHSKIPPSGGLGGTFRFFRFCRFMRSLPAS